MIASFCYNRRYNFLLEMNECTVDDVCSVDVLRILTIGYDRGFFVHVCSLMVSVQNYLCKENRFRVRIFGLHLAQIGQLYNLYNTPFIYPLA